MVHRNVFIRYYSYGRTDTRIIPVLDTRYTNAFDVRRARVLQGVSHDFSVKSVNKRLAKKKTLVFFPPRFINDPAHTRAAFSCIIICRVNRMVAVNFSRNAAHPMTHTVCTR